MKLYLAGPMADLPEHNFPLFHRETARLRALGYDIVNPAEINVGPIPEKPTFEHWRKCMIADFHELLSCQGIALLPNWKRSPGATAEYALARVLRFHIIQAHELTYSNWTGNAHFIYPEHFSSPVPAERPDARQADARGGDAGG